MNQSLTILLPVLSIGLAAALLAARRSRRTGAPLPPALRILLAIGSVAIVAFCGFGFLAGFEPGPQAIPARIIYGGIGVLVASVATRMLIPQRTATRTLPLLLGALLAATPAPGRAAGLLVADGGFGGVLEIKEHDVKVAINNGVAVTHVTQIFRNTEQRQVEALYTFPVPKGASVANFSMWINGKEMVGEVLEKKRAREIYQSYKQTRRDPGLLEQTDYRTFEMRIFPIAPGAEQKVQLTYYQELPSDHDWATYVYPLATTAGRQPDTKVNGKFAIAFDIKSAVPVAAIESPSHGPDFVFARHSEHYQQASLEVNGGSLSRDVVLAAKLVRPQTGVDLLTSTRSGEDGFFCLTLTAGEELAAREEGMDYVFVLDISGSMAHDGKLLLSKDCIGAFLGELGEKDRFDVITFNVAPSPAFSSARQADAQAKSEAIAWLAGARAAGGTVLEPALTTAYKYASGDRPLSVVILSDGMTEQRERTSLLRLIGQRPAGAKVFCIGVGNDVNRPLLEQLADDSGGLAAFLSRGDDFTRQAKAFRRKLLRPVASGLKIDFGGIEVAEVEPRQLPNLYHGAPVRIYGRYRGSGPAKLKLRADVNGVAWEQTAALDFPKHDESNPEIERMWAWRRIDGLLKDADRNGTREPVIPEIVRLGEQFSIVTEYTSFLVLENDAEYQRWKIERTNGTRLARDRAVQLTRATDLERLREKAVAGVGPQPVLAQAAPLAVQPQGDRDTPVAVPAASSRKQSRDLSLPSFGGGGGGSGPVGPLFVLFSALLGRRRKH